MAELKIQKAMVLAAGLGQRMRPLTDDRPKPLVEVAEKPLIDYTLDRLSSAGVEEAIVNVHYLADLLEAHLEGRRAPQIKISDERDQLMDTGGGMKKAAALLGDDPIFYANTDAILINGMSDPYRRLMRAWRDDEMDALLLMASTCSASGYDGLGDFMMDPAGRLTRRKEKTIAPFVWSGVQIIHPRLLADTPDEPFSTNLLWNKAAEAGRLYGISHDGFWMHVGSPDGLEEAEKRLNDLRRGAA